MRSGPVIGVLILLVVCTSGADLASASAFKKRLRIPSRPLPAPVSDSFGDPSGSGISQNQEAIGEVAIPSDLIQQSSFPVRTVTGEVDSTAASLPPLTSLDPGHQLRRFKVDDCILEVSSGFTALTSFQKAEDGELRIANDAIHAHGVLMVAENEKLIISAASELRVRVVSNTKRECERRFAGRRTYLGDAVYRDASAFLLSKNSRIEASLLTEPKSTGVWLHWSDPLGQPRLEDDTGYGVLLETGRFAFTPVKGESWLGMRLPWRMVLKPVRSNAISSP